MNTSSTFAMGHGPKSAFLIVGGTGTTGLALVQLLLQKTEHTLLITSRRGQDGIPSELSKTYGDRVKGIQFSWEDRSRYRTLFSDNSTKIEAIFLIPPSTGYTDKSAHILIDIAVARDVQRVVLLSDTVHEKGDHSIGAQVHVHLNGLKQRGTLGVYAVLRSSWFYEREDLLKKNCLSSMTQGGKIGWVDVETIAETAFRALVDDPSDVFEQYIVTGPEALSYDEIASLLTRTLERSIVHHHLTEDQLVAHYKDMGLNDEFIEFYVECDRRVASGREEAVFNLETNSAESLKRVRGTKRLSEFLEENKHVLIPDTNR
ncbi:hypothetical protein V5O48_005396 [Marasmius crinis-equi]|uniref:NmrA-like domain-containing protein n=1 Tax=Marasmius crinis-equi TaxID=585013 RepID=A0ABR3FMI0_9AGAR